MTGKTAIQNILNLYKARKRQKDWSRIFTTVYGKTRIIFYAMKGLGDTMIARQFCESFTDYCRKEGDPDLGKIVFCAGAWVTDFSVEKGDINLYWWWSMNSCDDWLERYVSGANIKPDIICCLSSATLDIAREKGLRAVMLPLGVGKEFIPLELNRSGIGYAGSKGHKNREQEAIITEPFRDEPGFEWCDSFRAPKQLNHFYNTKKIILGMTEEYQEKYGMVNNRVFEVLATATPLIIHKHPYLEDMLGFEYKYQTDTAERTKELSNDILTHYPKYREEFLEYSKIVRERHSYYKRIKALVQFLKEKEE